jgi:hypothetical protein
LETFRHLLLPFLKFLGHGIQVIETVFWSLSE